MSLSQLQQMSRQQLKELLMDSSLSESRRRDVRTAYRAAFRRAFGKFLREWSDQPPGKCRTMLRNSGGNIETLLTEIVERLENARLTDP